MTEHDQPRDITYAEAVREAIGQAMEADDRVFMLGEDIGVYGGAFGVSGDLYHRFGAERIRDTPISELGIVGAAVGAALAGMRPIVEIQFSDFTNQAMDQIVNQAAKIHFMLGGAATVPMVLRAPTGSGTGAAAQHSQSLEAWFAHVPGPQGRDAGDGGGRQGPAALGDRRPQPGDRARAQAALPHVRPGARGGRARPARQDRRAPHAAPT